MTEGVTTLKSLMAWTGIHIYGKAMSILLNVWEDQDQIDWHCRARDELKDAVFHPYTEHIYN